MALQLRVLTRYAPMLSNIGWKTFLVFAIFNVFDSVYAFFLIKETQGKSLEEMEVVFGSVAALHRKDTEDLGVESQAEDERQERNKVTSVD